MLECQGRHAKTLPKSHEIMITLTDRLDKLFRPFATFGHGKTDQNGHICTRFGLLDGMRYRAHTDGAHQGSKDDHVIKRSLRLQRAQILGRITIIDWL